MILDSSGSTVAAFEAEDKARATLYTMCVLEPDAADHLVLLTYGDDGMPVGEALTFSDIATPARVRPSDFVQPNVSEMSCGRTLKVNRYVPALAASTNVLTAA